MDKENYIKELESKVSTFSKEKKEELYRFFSLKWQKAEKDNTLASFPSPDALIQAFLSQNNYAEKPSVVQFHPGLQMETEKKETNAKVVKEGEKALSFSKVATQEEKVAPALDSTSKKGSSDKDMIKKHRPIWLLLLTSPLWICFLLIFLLFNVIFTLSYLAFFAACAGSILYSIYWMVGAVFQGIHQNIFPAFFQLGVGILGVVIAVFFISGINLSIRSLWKLFKKAGSAIFYRRCAA